MEPYEWGPTFWRALHTVTFYYPDSPSVVERDAARDFFNSLVYLLPCDECCEHYAQMLEQHPIESALVGRQELSHWLYDLHDAVNQRLGKKPSPSYSEVRSDYLKLNKKPAPVSRSQPAIKPSQQQPQQQQRLPPVARTPLDRNKILEIENRRLQFEQIRTRTATARASGTDVSRTGCKDCAQKRLARANKR